MEVRVNVVDQPRRPKRAKPKSKNRKFDQADRDSVDSGRMSRRGDTDNDVIDSDNDSLVNKDMLSPNEDMLNFNEDEERQSSGSPKNRQERGWRGMLASAASVGKMSPAQSWEGGEPRGPRMVSVSGDVESIGVCLAVDSGYTDRTYSSTPDGARDSALSGKADMDVGHQEDSWVDSHTPRGHSDYGYRSIPASRQDGESVGQSEGGESTKQERGCQSARVTWSSKNDSKQCLMQQSQSSPMLGTTQERTDCCAQEIRKCTQGNDDADREGVRNTCAANDLFGNRAAEEGLPGGPQHHFSDVALVSASVARKIKNAKVTSDTNKTPGGAKDVDMCTNHAAVSFKPQTRGADVTCRRKSVTWEDMANTTRSPTDEFVGEDSEGNKTNRCNIGREDTLKYDSPVKTSNIGGDDCSTHWISSSPDKEEDGFHSKLESAASNTLSVKEHLTAIVHLMGQLKVQVNRCASEEGFLHMDKFYLYRSKFEEVALLMQECKLDPQKVSDNLPNIRKQLLDLKSHKATGLCVDEDGTLAQDEVMASKDDSWSTLLSVVRGILDDVSEVIVLIVEVEALQHGTADVGTHDVITLLEQVQDGTYCPPTEDNVASVQADDQCRTRLCGCVTDELSGDICQTEENSDASSKGEDSCEDEDSDCGSIPSMESVDRLCEWPRYVCSTGACLGDDPIICVVHVDTHLVNVSQLKCEVVDPTLLPSVTEEFETLVGRVVLVTAEEVEQMSSENCYLVALPYRDSLVEEWQEIEVRELTQTGEWHKKPRTQHKAVLNDLEENTLRYVEVQTDRLSTLAVVASARVDKVKFDAKGTVATSSGDPRVSVNIAENTCYGDCRMSMRVFVPDACAIHEYRLIEEDNCAFKAASPLIDMSFTEDITNPVKVTVPMTMPLKRLMRASGRPVPKPDPFNEAELLLFQKKGNDDWKLVRYTRVFNVAGAPGLVTFEWFENEGRFVILCVGKEVSRRNIDVKATSFLKYTTLKVAELTLLQDPNCVRKVSVSLCPKQHGVRKRRPPKEEIDFTFVTEFMMREGQPFDISLRGNLKSNWMFPTRYMNYAVEPVSFSFEVEVLDRFCQRSLSHHCGFLQVLDPLRIMATSRSEAKVKDKDNAQRLKDAKPSVLTEICVRLPKPEVIPVQPLVRAPLNMKLCGGVSFETLREVALQVSDEWIQLARNLHIPHARIQSIVRNTKGKQPGQIALEVLYAWLKRIPVSHDKARVLCDALTRSGRPDLAATIRERDRQKKDIAIKVATEYNLKKAIVLVCRSPSVVNQWRSLAARLGLSKDDLAELDFLSLDQRDVCRKALERWQSLVNVRAEVKVLAQQLACLGCMHVAELISTAYGNIQMS